MSTTGAIGRAFYWLISLVVQLVSCVTQYAALAISVGVTVHTIGEYTREFIKDKKTVLDIIYWRDPKRTVGALVGILFALYLIARFTLLSLVSYGALAVLAGAVGFRLYKLVESQVKKTDGSNPFKPYLEQEVTIPRDRLHEQVDILIEHSQSIFKHLRHLFLVESVVDSVKFGLLLYTLTYVGAWFSGISLILIFVTALFTVPKVYEIYREPIDRNLANIKEHLQRAQDTIEQKVPIVQKFTRGGVSEPTKKEQ